MSGEITFEIGGRYRNRAGWYEVLDIVGDDMKVCYEENGQEDTLNIEMQRRILRNIEAEEATVLPSTNATSNAQYYRTLGIVCNYGYIEAVIPLKSKTGFDRNYFEFKG